MMTTPTPFRRPTIRMDGCAKNLPLARVRPRHVPQPAQLGRSSKFGFENPLPFFNLLQPGSVFTHHQYRHRFGVGHRSPTPRKNLLHFFKLLAKSTTDLPPHNRGVGSSDRGTPYIHNIIIGLWETHPPTLRKIHSRGVGRQP
jgi:hypothetical protein